MTDEIIWTKYEELLSSSSYSSLDKPTSIIMHNFFSTKEFAATMSTSEEQNLIDNICNTNVIIIITNNQTDNLAKPTDNSTLHQKIPFINFLILKYIGCVRINEPLSILVTSLLYFIGLE